MAYLRISVLTENEEISKTLRNKIEATQQKIDYNSICEFDSDGFAAIYFGQGDTWIDDVGDKRNRQNEADSVIECCRAFIALMPLFKEFDKDFIHFISLEETYLDYALATTGNCEKDIEEANEIIKILSK